jgi:hypothetical protein
MADNNFPTVSYFQDNEIITAKKLNTLTDAAHYAEAQVVNANNVASAANQTAQSVVEAANQAKENTNIAQQAATNAAKDASDAKSLASDADTMSQKALAKINSYVDTTNLVNLNVAQTITGVKTFTRPIVGSFQTNQINTIEDLNNYQQDGKYFFSQAPKNAPFDKPAIVLIQSGVNQSLTPNTQLVIQTIYDFENIKHPEVRTYNNGNWSNWQLLGGEINTAKINEANTFTADNTFSANVYANGVTSLSETKINGPFDVNVNAGFHHDLTVDGVFTAGGIHATEIPVPIQTTNNDLNTIGESGHVVSYYVSSAVANAPTDPDTQKSATQGIVTDKYYNNNVHIQTYEDTDTGYTYSRHYTNSAWSNWILLTPHN